MVCCDLLVTALTKLKKNIYILVGQSSMLQSLSARKHFNWSSDKKGGKGTCLYQW